MLLLSITVNPIPSYFPSLERCALIILLHFSGSTVILVRFCSIRMSVLFINLSFCRSISFSNPSQRALRLVLVVNTVSLVLWVEGSQLPPVSPLYCSFGNHDVPYMIAFQSALTTL